VLRETCSAVILLRSASVFIMALVHSSSVTSCRLSGLLQFHQALLDQLPSCAAFLNFGSIRRGRLVQGRASAGPSEFRLAASSKSSLMLLARLAMVGADQLLEDGLWTADWCSWACTSL